MPHIESLERRQLLTLTAGLEMNVPAATDVTDSDMAVAGDGSYIVAFAGGGNSGKIQALEYLNKHNPLALPNPRRLDISLGPKPQRDGAKLPLYASQVSSLRE